ncbi:MAG: TRAP transporter substrate-binding protein DctP, partial [Pseudomonadota bacterium]
VADRIAAATGGRIEIQLFAAGELAPALEAMDAVAGGAAQMAHTAPAFWGGKARVAPLFMAGPFGLTPIEHSAWLLHGGGQALWDALYADLGVKPLAAGNTGMSMGGWFKQPIETAADLSGLRWRMPGLGGEMYRRLGVAQVSLSPGEAQIALASGAVDAAEFAGPSSDLALGLHQAADWYYWPGVHEPNGLGELLIDAALWADLPGDLQAAIEQAAAEEALAGLAESELMNRAALDRITGEFGVTLSRFPDAVIAAARDAADDLYAELRALNGLQGRIAAAYDDARRAVGDWPRVSAAGFFDARA